MTGLRWFLVVFGALAALPASPRAQQDPSEGFRLVELRIAPETPTFGESFELQLTLRAAPEVMLLLPDTLVPSEVAQSYGPGSWRTTPAVGDSTDVLAAYPAIGYREGRLDLPVLQLWTRPSRAGADPVRRAGEGQLLAGDRAQTVMLGAVVIPELAAMADSGAVLVPRPPADVLGGNWSVWLILGVGVVSMAGIVGAGRAAPRWWAATGGALLTRWRQKSPRDLALIELDHLRSLGWHRNGRLDEFYASTTGVLRRFVHEIEPPLSTALTSTELLSEIESRWGAKRAEGLREAIGTAETAKFGAHRPSAENAEADWTSVRDWIRSAPET
jgi:hypothetical protein